MRDHDHGRFALELGGLCLVGLLVLGLQVEASTPNFLFGSEPGGQFGRSVRDAGDFDGDGIGDVIVGAPNDDTGGLSKGRAFLWFGGPSLRKAADLVFSEGNAGDQFGYSVAGIGDVNADGFDDVAVGAPLNDAMGAEAGAVYVYYGGASPDNVVDLVLRGEEADDRFGWSVNRAGDMNRDGRSDFAVGAPWADMAGLDVGAVYLWYGAPGGPAAAFDRRFVGEAGGSGEPGFINGPGFGYALADLNGYRGDNRSSLAVGAPYYAGKTGRAYLFFDASTPGGDPALTAGTIFTNAVANELFGFALSRAGRIGNATRDDLLIGAPGAFGDTGYAKIFYGDATPAATVASSAADLTLNGQTSGDRFGESVSDVGNHDGAGGDDFAVGAPARDETAQNAGRVYLYSGSSSVPTDVPAVNGFGGASVSGDFFGTALSTAGGDLDGDGLDELLIGSPSANDRVNAVQGAAIVLGSGPGVVAVPQLVWAQRSSDTATEFRVSGLLPNLRFAQLRDADEPARVLADLADGFRLEADTWVVTVTRDRLVGVERVELVWEDSIGASRSEFELRSTPTRGLRLVAAVPNPFNPRTTIQFELAERQEFELRVYDARGRHVRSLARGTAGPGTSSVEFDGRDDRGRALASGNYRAVLFTDAGVRSLPLTLTK